MSNLATRAAGSDAADMDVGKGLWIGLARIAGLAAMLYLVGWGLYLTFLTLVFGSSDPSLTASGFALEVFVNTMPALICLTIGLAGIILAPSKRFGGVGLLAISIEVALAAYFYVVPESMLWLTGS